MLYKSNPSKIPSPITEKTIDTTKMCPKGKTKIHPSPPPASSSSPLTALHLLPPAVLTIVSLLSPSDRQVLAYLILRSLQNPTALKPKTPSKKCATPVFDCGCFDCYTSFWIRWDSSPNRDLIHQAIEAFEDHISDLSANTHKANPRRSPRQQSGANLSTRGECSTQTKNGNCKKEKEAEAESVVAEEEQEISEGSCNRQAVVAAAAAAGDDDEEEENVEGEVSGNWSVRRSGGVGCNCKRGFVRKVWPDVLGLCNSRLWSLWSPNL